MMNNNSISSDFVLNASCKGYPLTAEPCAVSALGQRGWHLLEDALAYPVAVLRRPALTHNLAWMQDFVQRKGVALAPHGKTTMSPELFRMQLQAGAWGLTFANVHQLRVGLAAGAQRAIIAEAQTREDYARHVVEELQALHLVAGEEDELAERRQRLMSLEKAAEEVREADEVLNGPSAPGPALAGLMRRLMRKADGALQAPKVELARIADGEILMPDVAEHEQVVVRVVESEAEAGRGQRALLTDPGQFLLRQFGCVGKAELGGIELQAQLGGGESDGGHAGSLSAATGPTVPRRRCGPV